MFKVYNTEQDISRGFEQFLINNVSNIRKTQSNIIPHILFGMIKSESVSSFDIAKSLKSDFSHIKFDSIVKRINRFFNNNLFDPYSFYHDIISSALSNYKKKHSDKRIHIIFDHTFSHSNYTIFMFSMRIGKQGIPLWFKCFKDVSSNDAFKLKTIRDGIKAVSDLFKDYNFDLIFLADRWFGYPAVLDFIHSLGHTYCIRIKKNAFVYHFDNKEKHFIRKYIYNLNHYKFKSAIYYNIDYTDLRYKTNNVFSDCINVSEPWIIATNGDPRRAIKDYSYRFGGIESLFKNQKSNGFNLTKISNASLKAFTSMYSLACVATLYLTIFLVPIILKTPLVIKMKELLLTNVITLMAN